MSGRRRSSRAPSKRGGFAMAVKEHRRGDGTRETLTITASEVIHVESRRGHETRRALPLADLRDVRATRRVRDLELVVALAYILAASVLLYVLVNAFQLLTEIDRLVLFGLCVAAAAVGALVAWLGQEAILVFVGRNRRIKYPVSADDETGRMADAMKPRGRGD